MRETPNLLLKLPDPTDYVQVEDLNENFTKIDTELKRIESSMSDTEALTNIEQSVTNLDKKITQHFADNTKHITSAERDEWNLSFQKASEVESELNTFKSALLNGVTSNQFSDGLSTLDAFNVTSGYYNKSQSRLEA